jgi:hypothetical protein
LTTGFAPKTTSANKAHTPNTASASSSTSSSTQLDGFISFPIACSKQNQHNCCLAPQAFCRLFNHMMISVLFVVLLLSSPFLIVLADASSAAFHVGFTSSRYASALRVSGENEEPTRPGLFQAFSDFWQELDAFMDDASYVITWLSRFVELLLATSSSNSTL